jgi:LPS export ABC transporter protein LptC
LKRNTILAAGFLAACTLITWSWQRAVRDHKTDTGEEDAEVAGYYLLNAGFVSPGPDGHPLYRLDAARMTYGVATDLVEMDEVRIEYRQEEESDWLVTAPSGSARLDWRTLRLKGGVRVVFESGSEPPIVLTTPVLDVDATTSQATTSSEVKFTQGPYTVDAVGMSVDLTKGLVRLESRVNGLFTPP